MAIKYQGVSTVGEVTLVIPNFNKGGIEITARVLPEYVEKIAVATCLSLWLAEPEIGLNGIKNVSALLSKHINVEPGKRRKTTAFKPAKAPFNLKAKCLRCRVKQEVRYLEGTPILFRELEIGSATFFRCS